MNRRVGIAIACVAVGLAFYFAGAFAQVPLKPTVALKPRVALKPTEVPRPTVVPKPHLQVTRTACEQRLLLPADVLFEFNRATLSPDAAGALAELLEPLSEA